MSAGVADNAVCACLCGRLHVHNENTRTHPITAIQNTAASLQASRVPLVFVSYEEPGQILMIPWAIPLHGKRTLGLAKQEQSKKRGERKLARACTHVPLHACVLTEGTSINVAEVWKHGMSYHGLRVGCCEVVKAVSCGVQCVLYVCGGACMRVWVTRVSDCLSLLYSDCLRTCFAL